MMMIIIIIHICVFDDLHYDCTITIIIIIACSSSITLVMVRGCCSLPHEEMIWMERWRMRTSLSYIHSFVDG